MTYCAWGFVQRCDLWACRRNEKKKLSRIKLAICPDHPRRHRSLKFCMRGRVLEIVIYFKFHENRSRGLGAVEGRKSPSPISKAHGLYNSLYYRTSRDIRSETYQNLVIGAGFQQCCRVVAQTAVQAVRMACRLL